MPLTAAFTVNSNGAFFNGLFTVGARAYKGNTLMAQAAILIHELAHIISASGFQSDFGNAKAGSANDNLVNKNCGKLIEGLR